MLWILPLLSFNFTRDRYVNPLFLLSCIFFFLLLNLLSLFIYHCSSEQVIEGVMLASKPLESRGSTCNFDIGIRAQCGLFPIQKGSWSSVSDSGGIWFFEKNHWATFDEMDELKEMRKKMNAKRERDNEEIRMLILNFPYKSNPWILLCSAWHNSGEPINTN